MVLYIKLFSISDFISTDIVLLEGLEFISLTDRLKFLLNFFFEPDKRLLFKSDASYILSYLKFLKNSFSSYYDIA